MTDIYADLRAAIETLEEQTEVNSRIPWFSIEQPMFEQMSGEFESKLCAIPEADRRFLSLASPNTIRTLLAERDGFSERHRQDRKALREGAREQDALRKERNGLRAALQAFVDAQAVPSTSCKERPAYDQARDALAGGVS